MAKKKEVNKRAMEAQAKYYAELMNPDVVRIVVNPATIDGKPCFCMSGVNRAGITIVSIGNVQDVYSKFIPNELTRHNDCDPAGVGFIWWDQEIADQAVSKVAAYWTDALKREVTA